MCEEFHFKTNAKQLPTILHTVPFYGAEPRALNDNSSELITTFTSNTRNAMTAMFKNGSIAQLFLRG